MIFREMEHIDILELLLGDLMKQTYEYIMLIDVQMGTARKICSHGTGADESDEKPEKGFIRDIDVWLEDMFSRCYVGDDMQSLLRELNVKAMAERLENEKSAGVSFSIEEDGQIRRKYMEYRYLNGDTRMICLTNRDITSIYEEEQHQSQLLKHALDVAQKANQVRNEFLLHISHDVRTPLYGINGMLELAMQQDLSKEKTKEYLYKAKKSADELTKFLNNVLDMSVIEMGELIFDEQTIILKDFLSRVAFLLEPVAKEKNQQVIFEVKNAELAVLKVDPVRWSQIFQLIMENSLQYGFEGGYAKCEITIEKTEEGEGRAILTFSDNGRGMDEFHKQRAFQEFAYADKEQGGRGLGLSLVKNIVRKSGGTMCLKSKEGAGTVITVEIPCKGTTIAEEDFRRQVNHMVRKIDELDFTKFRALVVDDNDIAREITTIKLEQFGLQVDTARDGQEAIDMLNSSEENYYNIMFMVVQLPNKDGLQVAREIRESQRLDLSDITIVAITSHIFRDERIETLESGMDYHLPLPLDDVELKEILAKELFDLAPKKEFEARGFRVIK